MKRPTRLDILEYALSGVLTTIGTGVWPPDMPVADSEWLDELEAHRDWLEVEIARVKGEAA